MYFIGVVLKIMFVVVMKSNMASSRKCYSVDQVMWSKFSKRKIQVLGKMAKVNCKIVSVLMKKPPVVLKTKSKG